MTEVFTFFFKDVPLVDSRRFCLGRGRGAGVGNVGIGPRRKDELLAVHIRSVRRLNVMAYSPFAQDPKFRCRGNEPGTVRDGDWVYR